MWMPQPLAPGTAVLVTTYAGTTDNVVTSGMPLSVAGDWTSCDALLGEFWSALDASLRVAALAVRRSDIGGTFRQRAAVAV